MYVNIPRALDHLRSRQFYDRNYTQLAEPLVQPLLYNLSPATHLILQNNPFLDLNREVVLGERQDGTYIGGVYLLYIIYDICILAAV